MTTKERIEKIVSENRVFIQDAKFIGIDLAALADALIQAGVCFKDEVGIDEDKLLYFVDSFLLGKGQDVYAIQLSDASNLSKEISSHTKDLLTFK